MHGILGNHGSGHGAGHLGCHRQQAETTTRPEPGRVSFSAVSFKINADLEKGHRAVSSDWRTGVSRTNRAPQPRSAASTLSLTAAEPAAEIDRIQSTLVICVSSLSN